MDIYFFTFIETRYETAIVPLTGQICARRDGLIKHTRTARGYANGKRINHRLATPRIEYKQYCCPFAYAARSVLYENIITKLARTACRGSRITRMENCLCPSRTTAGVRENGVDKFRVVIIIRNVRKEARKISRERGKRRSHNSSPVKVSLSHYSSFPNNVGATRIFSTEGSILIITKINCIRTKNWYVP